MVLVVVVAIEEDDVGLSLLLLTLSTADINAADNGLIRICLWLVNLVVVVVVTVATSLSMLFPLLDEPCCMDIRLAFDN